MAGRRRLAPFIAGMAGLALLVAGCWDAVQLNAIALVDTIALDPAPAGAGITVSVATIRRAASQRDAAFPDTADRVAIMASSGPTVFDAVRRFPTQTGEKLVWGHARALLIGEDLARQGILPWLDFFVRDAEPRQRMITAVVRDAAARDALVIRPPIVETPGQNVAELAKVVALSGLNVPVDLKELVTRLRRPHGAVVGTRLDIIVQPSQPSVVQGWLPRPGAPGQPGLMMVGASVLTEGRLIGWLDDAEVRGLRWMLGKSRRGALTVPCPGQMDQQASLEMFEARVQRKVTWTGARPQVAIAVEQEARLADQACDQDLTNPAAQSTLEQAAARAIVGDMGQVLARAQQDLRADIFDFHSLVERQYPRQWQGIAERWDEVFPDLPVALQARVEIRRTGRSLAPITGGRREGR